MTRFRFVPLLFFLSIPTARAELTTALTVGTKSHHTTDDQLGTTLELIGRDHRWPVYLEGYAAGAWDKDHGAREETIQDSGYELGVGLGRMLHLGPFHPHVGAGVARAWSVMHIIPESGVERWYRDSRYRPWLTLEALFVTRANVVIGGTARWSEFRPTRPSFGGTLLGFTIGWSNDGK